MIKVGLLGTGRIGSLHAENIASHRESTLDAVADIDDQSANNLAAQFGAIVKSADEIISDTNIDAILIATSTDCLLYTSPSPRDWTISRMPSSA